MKKYCTVEVIKILEKYPIVENLARKKFIVLFLIALIKTRKVHFCELAQVLNNEVKASSNETRIEDFFREVPLNYEQMALLLAMFLPRRGKVTLCIDRTEWDFGKCQVNILMIIVRCKGMTIPLYWELLDNKSGNSSTDDRIALLKQCIQLLGAKRIGLFLADREFIGHRWFVYLKKHKIHFCVRIPKHHKITRFYHVNGEEEKVEELLSKSKVVKIQNCMIDGVWGNMYARRLSCGDILFIFGTVKTKFLAPFYKKRWRIEMFFQQIKNRGFDLESTHLNQLPKLKKLIGLVSLAYAFAVSMGVHHHKKVKPIKCKKHGYFECSFARKGINIIREGFRKDWVEDFQLFTQFIHKFLRWININPNQWTLPLF